FLVSTCVVTHSLHSFPARRSSDLRPHCIRPSNEPQDRLGLVTPCSMVGGQFADRSDQKGSAEYEDRISNSLRIQWGNPSPSLEIDRKSTRLNSSHVKTSHAVCCLS